jgi:hypothetical protein
LLRLEANVAGLEAGLPVLFDKRKVFADVEIGHAKVFDLEPVNDLFVASCSQNPLEQFCATRSIGT